MILSVFSSISSAWSSVWPYLVAILFFGFIILIHEFGHFIFAKLFKVKVNEFSLGMGPLIFKKKGKETQYSIRLLPIGGYISMEGEDEESKDEAAFCNKAVWKRMIIVAAGATFNLILGLIICIGIVNSDDLVGTNTIISFNETVEVSDETLMPMDEILEIDGLKVYSDYDISFLLQRNTTYVYDIVVLRDGEKVELEDVEMDFSNGFGFTILGVEKTVTTVVSGAAKYAVSMCRMIYINLYDLVTGVYGMDDMAGPIGTVTVIADVAESSERSADWGQMFTIMALITINIGIFNLLPIPALDGGRLFFMFIELIRRKPIPAKYESWVHGAGLLLIFGLMLVISAGDIWKLISGQGFY